MQSNSRPCYVLPKITPKSFEYQKAKLNHTKLGFAMLDHTCLSCLLNCFDCSYSHRRNKRKKSPCGFLRAPCFNFEKLSGKLHQMTCSFRFGMACG